MNNISVCIPFYNTSKYLHECLKYILNDDFVSEIIISDDCSSDDEWKKLNQIVNTFNTSKIKVFRNEKNLGGFRNKYISIFNATSEWVYLLDSDNYFDETTISDIKNIKSPDPNICYCPQFSVFFNNEEIIIRNFDFLYEKIGISEIKECLSYRNSDTLFSMFLNDGNYIINRKKYLERIKLVFESSEDPSSADAICFQYYWIINGGYSKIIPVKYWHRLRLDSYWWTEGSKSMSSSKKYENLFLETNMDSSKGKKISIITACKNRIDALKISLVSWLNFKEIHEVIIIDWSSDEPINYLTEWDSRIKVVRVNDKQYFNQPEPLNLGAKIASGDYILKLDSDHVLNPYYNFVQNYFPEEKSFVSGSLDFENPEVWSEEHKTYIVPSGYYENLNNSRKMVYAYSPMFKHLRGLLFINKKFFNDVGGYNENLGDHYAYEDEEMYNRLKLYGLDEIKLSFDYSAIHLPHQDKKRYENFKKLSYHDNFVNNVRSDLQVRFSHFTEEELEWNIEYALAEEHIKRNKIIIGKIESYYAPPKTKWDIVPINEQNSIAYDISITNNPLESFPSVRCISLEECEDRRTILSKSFEKYQITPKFILSKRYSESNDKITGKYAHTLNDGTKGCCVSHLKMIKDWYETTNEEYGFFCEDDLSLETIDFWEHSWGEFFNTKPSDAECLQLLTIRQEFDTFDLRERCWDDWGATAYILNRSGAKKIIDNYVKNENGEDVYHLQIPNFDIQPLIENIIFASVVKTYTIPLFVENINLQSTFQDMDDDCKNGHKNNHINAHHKVIANFMSKLHDNNLSVNLQVKEPTELENLLTAYSLDTENPEHNFNLGVFYDREGHTAPALSYFLRCAERASESDPTLAYEALIRGSYCYFKQGTRDGSGRGMLWQAQMFLPHRPEAYYLLARYAQRKEWWQDCYSTSELALINCDFNLPPLRTDVEYPGVHGILFEKGISGWWWGKVEESRSILIDILENYNVSDADRQILITNLEKMGVNMDE